MKFSTLILSAALLTANAPAAEQRDEGRHAIRVGDTESELIRQLGVPQRKIAVEDSFGHVVGKHLYYTVESGSIRFYIEDGRIQEISNLRGND